MTKHDQHLKGLYDAAVAKLHKMDTPTLEKAVGELRGQLMSGRNLTLPTSDLTLQLAATAKQLLADRQSGAAEQQEDEETVVERLMRDAPGITEDTARAHLAKNGDPYAKARKKITGEVDQNGNTVKQANYSDETPSAKLSRLTGVDEAVCARFIEANGMPNLEG